MNFDESERAGIPTRALHEAYLDAHRALKRYRTAKDRADSARMNEAHGDVQEAVVTLYEMLRPHLRDNDTVRKYWNGRPPTYNRDGTPPDYRDGDGILHVQQRTQRVNLEDIDGDEPQHLEEWHDRLGLNGNVRLQGLIKNGSTAIVQYEAYELGLKNLDDWETKYESTTEDAGGFMKGKTVPSKRQVRVDMPRLKRAARELAQAAKDMGFLSKIETPTNDDPLPI